MFEIIMYINIGGNRPASVDFLVVSTKTGPAHSENFTEIRKRWVRH